MFLSLHTTDTWGPPSFPTCASWPGLGGCWNVMIPSSQGPFASFNCDFQIFSSVKLWTTCCRLELKLCFWWYFFCRVQPSCNKILLRVWDDCGETGKSLNNVFWGSFFAFIIQVSRERQETGGTEGGNDTQDRPAQCGIQTGVVCSKDCSLNAWGGCSSHWAKHRLPLNYILTLKEEFQGIYRLSW